MQPPLPLSPLASLALLMTVAVVKEAAAVKELLVLLIFLCLQNWAGKLKLCYIEKVTTLF